MQPGVVYTTFHHARTGANVVTTDYSDWATNCPEYKVTAVQVSKTAGLSEFQKADRERDDAHRRVQGVKAPSEFVAAKTMSFAQTAPLDVMREVPVEVAVERHLQRHTLRRDDDDAG